MRLAVETRAASDKRAALRDIMAIPRICAPSKTLRECRAKLRENRRRSRGFSPPHPFLRNFRWLRDYGD